jgi:hypothetical protein
MDRASNAALWITIGCALAFFGLLLAHSISPAPTAPQPVDDRSTPTKAAPPAPPTEARVETVATPVPAVQSIRMFPPFSDGCIKWEGFDLPVVPASRDNVRAYIGRMKEFYDEFDRAVKCRTQQERTEQAGRFIIQCDSKIGFDGVVVPDSYVEWTKLFVQVIQIRAESMYLPWGIAETEFLVKHKEGEIHAQAIALLETLTKSQASR